MSHETICTQYRSASVAAAGFALALTYNNCMLHDQTYSAGIIVAVICWLSFVWWGSSAVISCISTYTYGFTEALCGTKKLSCLHDSTVSSAIHMFPSARMLMCTRQHEGMAMHMSAMTVLLFITQN